MDKNNRPEDIEDYLSQLHGGNWFGFTDSKNKIYSNLILHPKVWNPKYVGDKHDEGLMDNPYSKPTEKECTDGLKAMQDAHDAQAYARTRRTLYPSIQEQLDMQYWDAVNGTKKWQEAVAKVKTDNPKP